VKSDRVIKLVFHWIAKWKLDFTDLHIPPWEPQVRSI